MSLLKAIKAQLGLSSTATQNFTLDASAADGTMKLARGNAGATTQDILTVDAAGKVKFPQGSGDLSYTSQVTPLPTAANVNLSVAHGLGVTPTEATFEFVCLTAEFGYVAGDVVSTPLGSTGTYLYPPQVWRNSTNIGAAASFGSGWFIAHKTTGAGNVPTAANWAYRFKLRTV